MTANNSPQERIYALQGVEKLPKGKDAYKRRFEAYGCFNPECQNGLDLEVHHIVPRSMGGNDEFDNYIMLCQDCHDHLKNHSDYRNRMVILWTYKFYFESKLRGENGLPELPTTDREAEKVQGEDRPEILQFEMSDNLSQSVKDQEEHGKFHKGIEWSPGQVRNKEQLRQCACGCGRKLEPKRPWQIYASAKCRRFANSKSCSIRKEALKKIRYHLSEAMETLRELEK
jgi:hypothetical protein